jgi:hypothetical protein
MTTLRLLSCRPARPSGLCPAGVCSMSCCMGLHDTGEQRCTLQFASGLVLRTAPSGARRETVSGTCQASHSYGSDRARFISKCVLLSSEISYLEASPSHADLVRTCCEHCRARASAELRAYATSAYATLSKLLQYATRCVFMRRTLTRSALFIRKQVVVSCREYLAPTPARARVHGGRLQATLYRQPLFTGLSPDT